MKHRITICTGTACYVLGGAELLLLEEYLPAGIRKETEITGVPCLGFCQTGASMKPPFVLIDGAVIGEASIQKIVDCLVGE